MAKCKKCNEDLQFEPNERKDGQQVQCPHCKSRYTTRWVASFPGAPLSYELVPSQD
ncbi:hypothetical protein QEM13_003855 [Pseudomonas putida]|nr:hypothetical protein [Pseudomonas putida]